jgi:hypothetical protein
VQFCFRHRSFEPQQQTIIIDRRIIHTIGIGNQRVEQRADLQQLMPVPARSRQARHLNANNQSDVAETNLRDQSLKAKATFDGRARSPEIVVDDHDGLARPPKSNGAVNQRVLQSRRLLVTFDLLRCGLPDVDDRQALAMLPVDFFRHDAASTRHKTHVGHRQSPRQEIGSEAVAEPSGPASRRYRAVAPAAASAKQAEADIRSSRDPSQRARALSAWNPTLGDSSNSVNLSAALSMAYRKLLLQHQSLSTHRHPL